MKVGEVATDSAIRLKRPYRELTSRTLTRLITRPARPPNLLAHGDQLVRSRAAMGAEADRLRSERQGMEAPAPVVGDPRVLSQIVRELHEAFRLEPQTERLALGPSPVPRAKANAIRATGPSLPVIELIERIDTLVRFGRPTLALTLNSAFARVEIEKTGPGQVALKIQGWNGPPPPAELSRIRETLRQRGLILTSLSLS